MKQKVILCVIKAGSVSEGERGCERGCVCVPRAELGVFGGLNTGKHRMDIRGSFV
jgi:hypothetical protein